MSKLNSWLQVSANIGIVLGLVLVGFQLKQNSDLVRLQLIYEESYRAIGLETLVVGEQGAEVWAKSVEEPENLTLAEVRIMEALLWSFIEQVKSTYRLAELGLLDEEDWRRRVDNEVTFYLGYEYSQAWWENYDKDNQSVPPKLRQAINQAIASITQPTRDYITGPRRLIESE